MCRLTGISGHRWGAMECKTESIHSEVGGRPEELLVSARGHLLQCSQVQFEQNRWPVLTGILVGALLLVLCSLCKNMQLRITP